MQRIHSDRPDLILLDIKMPGVDGFMVLADLRNAGNNLPVLMCSGSDLQSDIDRAFELGCNGYFVKPAGIDGYRRMASAVANYWSGSELPRH
jgi:CheY-like chemotaxis protein